MKSAKAMPKPPTESQNETEVKVTTKPATIDKPTTEDTQ
jgi:hypothetical protein